mmetsp:Transcript_29707/g.94545  ORF Transcript_29707/g.94545 Transcript_29707/m.94545 type:complete len:253 (-) Transcript_29707:588-1346(-)
MGRGPGRAHRGAHPCARHVGANPSRFARRHPIPSARRPHLLGGGGRVGDPRGARRIRGPSRYSLLSDLRAHRQAQDSRRVRPRLPRAKGPRRRARLAPLLRPGRLMPLALCPARRRRRPPRLGHLGTRGLAGEGPTGGQGGCGRCGGSVGAGECVTDGGGAQAGGGGQGGGERREAGVDGAGNGVLRCGAVGAVGAGLGQSARLGGHGPFTRGGVSCGSAGGTRGHRRALSPRRRLGASRTLPPHHLVPAGR